MTDFLWLAVALLAGGGLGLFFFGGLWLTVQRLATSNQPALLFMGSFVLRFSVTLLGFYLIANGRWERLAAGLVGFLLVRVFFVMR